MDAARLLFDTELFVKDVFESLLPKGMHFHDLSHTLRVVQAAFLLSRELQLSQTDSYVVRTAAFLHDIGYVRTYVGHELKGAEMARDFLLGRGASAKFTDKVCGCILATRFPQAPTNILEEIICDADLYHFSLPDYIGYAESLRAEWKAKLNMEFSDWEWDQGNLELLSSHRYLTSVAREIWFAGKQVNISRLQARQG